jgi:hypothetical protein
MPFVDRHLTPTQQDALGLVLSRRIEHGSLIDLPDPNDTHQEFAAWATSPDSPIAREQHTGNNGHE